MKNRPSKKVFIYDSSDCTRKIVSKNFLNDFTHIRAYHACRPKDVGDYLKNGIQLFSIEKLNDLAAQLFNIPVKKIDHFAPTFQKDITNRIYFSLFKSELLKWSGHYLYYGSEHFLGIASYLDQDTSWHYRNILSQTGIPTIFTCDIAISLISKPQLLDIEKNFNFFNKQKNE